jgi:hypothetical protein
MFKNLSILCFLCFFITNSKAQDLVQSGKSESKSNENNNSSLYLVKDFPEGVYLTYDDFLHKNFIYMGDAIERRTIVGLSNVSIDRNLEADHVFFYNNRNNTKITNYFAISYNGNLYIQQRYLQKFSAKEDRNQTGDNPNSYHLVINDGKFLYIEGPFANSWSKGFAYGSGGAIGGVIGSSLNRLKGVVFDVEKKEFNFIRDCKDLNLLIEKYNGSKIECTDKKVDILTVRENINKIIK